MSCNHAWRKVFEEALFGGTFPVGWECVKCGKFAEQNKLGPMGLPGNVLGGARLIGPHGARSQCADGSPYKEQIIDEAGQLHIVRE